MARGDSWEKVRHRQRRALARFLRDEVHPFSDQYRHALDKAGLATGKLAQLDDLRRLPTSSLDEVEPGRLVLRPTEEQILRRGRWRLRWGAVAAKIANKPAAVNRLVIEPAYKPIHWQIHAGVPVGYTSEDLDRLAETGRHWLELAGIRRNDVIVSLLPEGPNLAFWELALGARRAGVALAALPPGTSYTEIGSLGPTALVGEPDELIRVLIEARPGPESGPELVNITTLVAAGPLLDDSRRERLEALRPGAVVVSAHAPPGVRSLWMECRSGRALHVDPDVEMVEVLAGDRPAPQGDVGDLVWTGIGWRGSVILRLTTGLRGRMDTGRCPVCERFLPRLWIEPATPSPGAILAEHPEVVAWATVGGDADQPPRALVALKDRRRARRVLTDLAQALPDLEVVVAPRKEVERHLSDQNGDRPGA